MGYGVHAYAVDLAKVRSVVGSGDAKLVKQIAKKSADELEQIDDIDDAEPSAKECLAQLVDGETEDGDVNFKYGYALELVCRHFGEWLPNRSWSAMRFDWFDTVDKAIGKLGKRSLSARVFYSGVPVEIPRPEDFPMIGHLEKDEIVELAAALRAAKAKKKKLAPDVVESLDELLGWLDAGAKRGGLVTFYY